MANQAWTCSRVYGHSAKVINYLRTVLNALKIQKEWKGRENLPCCRLLFWSVSVFGRRSVKACKETGPALCFFFSHLFCSIVPVSVSCVSFQFFARLLLFVPLFRSFVLWVFLLWFFVPSSSVAEAFFWVLLESLQSRRIFACVFCLGFSLKPPPGSVSSSCSLSVCLSFFIVSCIFLLFQFVLCLSLFSGFFSLGFVPVPPWFFPFSLWFSAPFYREACPSTSPAFAGLLWNPRTRSWARDMVHDQICCSRFPCWTGFIRANVGDDEQCFQNSAVLSLGMTVFQFGP